MRYISNRASKGLPANLRSSFLYLKSEMDCFVAPLISQMQFCFPMYVYETIFSHFCICWMFLCFVFLGGLISVWFFLTFFRSKCVSKCDWIMKLGS